MMKRILAILLALLLCGVALAEEAVVAETAVEAAEGVAVEAAVDAEAEANEAVIGEAEAEANEAVAEANAAAVTVKNKQTVNLYVGQSVQLKVKGKKIKKCASKNKGVASVTKKGVVTAKQVGTAKITITLKNNKKVNVTVSVLPEAAMDLKDLIGLSMEDAVKRVGGSMADVQTTEFSSYYLKDGICFSAINGSSTASIYNNVVSVVDSEVPGVCVEGISPGETLESAKNKAANLNYAVSEKMSTYITYRKQSVIAGGTYDEYLTIGFVGGQVNAVEYIIEFTGDDEPPIDGEMVLSDTELTHYIGKDLRAVVAQEGGNVSEIDSDEINDAYANIGFMFVADKRLEEKDKYRGKINEVQANDARYTVLGIAPGMPLESARKKALDLGFVVTQEDDYGVYFGREQGDNNDVYNEDFQLYVDDTDEPKVDTVRYFTYYSC